MLTRLKTAIPLIILFSLAFLLPPPWGPLVFLLIAAGMLYGGLQETFALSLIKHTKLDILLVFIFAFPYGIFSIHPAAMPLLLSGYILAAALLLFRRTPTPDHLRTFFTSLGIFLYLGWTLSFLVKIYFLTILPGPKLLLALIATTKMADIGAYFLGSLTAKLPGGNHKLAPVLSPKKSWEGLLGGCIFACLTAMFLLLKTPLLTFDSLPLFTWKDALLLGLSAAVLGLLGDLLESALKRSAQAKDSGHIPGLGGILDILDSLIPMGPLFYVYLMLKFC